MYKLLVALPLMLGLAACETQGQSTLLGAATGAAIGRTVSGPGDKTLGTLVGGAAGAIAGNLIGRTNTPGECLYEAANGQRYRARC